MPHVYVFFLATAFKTGRTIRLLTRRPYNHVAFSFTPEGDALYSFARYRYHEPLLGGFVWEATDRYEPQADRVGLRVCRVAVSQQLYDRLQQRIRHYCLMQPHTSYSFADLLVYPFRRHIRLAYTHTCISFLSELLELPQIHTIGQLENLLREQIIYTGTLGDSVTRFSHGPIDFFERRSRRVVYWQSGKALCRQAGQLVLHGLHRL